MTGPANLTPEERFWSHVDATGICWLWTLSDNGKGYGQVRWQGRIRKTHQVAWEILVGKCPDGMDPDHLCKVTICCNPDHLEWVPQAVNSRRSSAGAVNGNRIRSKTHCPADHPYDDANTYRDASGKRHCRACGRDKARRYRASKRVAA